MTEPKNILIIRLSAIGDVVFASPLIKALRRRYPDAKISWLIEPAAAPLLKNTPGIDELIVWPKAEWKQLWKRRKYLTLLRELGLLRKRLKAKQFDLAIDLQGLLKSGVWAYLSGAAKRIGLGSKEGSARFMSEVIIRQGDDPRIGSEYYHLAAELGLDVAEFEMEIALSEEDDAYAAEFRAMGEYAVICPFTTRPQKHWVEARWPVLAEQIMAQRGIPVMMLGGPADVAAAARIHAANGEIINLVGKSSLTQTAAVIKQSALLVGVDTGLTHMGIAFDVPTLALFGSTCPYTETTHDNARVLYHKMSCSPCRRNPSCDDDFTCMKKLTIEEIMANVVDVMP